jgi:hypothetical protein
MNRCLLCHAPAEYLGVFLPATPERYIAVKPKPGKTRGIAYGLCEPCFVFPDKSERVETVLEHEATRRRN